MGDTRPGDSGLISGREPVSHRYSAAMGQLRAAQKPGAGEPAYLRWVNRPLGRRLAALAATVGMTPNQVTALSGLTSGIAIVCIAALPPSWVVSVGAAALLLLGYALDSADGQLARLTRSGNRAGEWLDHLVDAARLPALHLAIAWTLMQRTPPSEPGAAVAIGFALVSSVWFFGQILAGQLIPRTTSVAPTAGVVASFAKLPNDVGTLYLAVALLASTTLFVPVYSVLFVIALITMIGSLRRKWAVLAALPQGRP